MKTLEFSQKKEYNISLAPRYNDNMSLLVSKLGV